MNIGRQTAYDALVVGGGPAGATAAILLAQAGWQVAIVEKTPFPRRKVCGEFVSAAGWPLLRELGVAASLLSQAGPEIRRVGLYAGATMLSANMPSAGHKVEPWGRALGREHLDTALLARARQAGAQVLQPWKLSRIEQITGGYLCSRDAKAGAPNAGKRAEMDVRARIVIDAHGSWEPGSMRTRPSRCAPLAADLFAFKAHFRNGRLPVGLMPLLLFPGGYGGMVQTDRGRVTLSCCIRRDVLDRCRRASKSAGEHARASEVVLAHVRSSCRGVGEALSGATLDGAWLSAGPIRPGIRPFRRDGVFSVGNAAGEAHPIVAEGISMAIQSAYLLCALLVGRKDAALAANSREALAAIAREYERGWRRNFFARIRAANLFAHLGMWPATARLAVALLQRAPAMLTFGAYCSGKTQSLQTVQ